MLTPGRPRHWSLTPETLIFRKLGLHLSTCQGPKAGTATSISVHTREFWDLEGPVALMVPDPGSEHGSASQPRVCVDTCVGVCVRVWVCRHVCACVGVRPVWERRQGRCVLCWHGRAGRDGSAPEASLCISG